MKKRGQLTIFIILSIVIVIIIGVLLIFTRTDLIVPREPRPEIKDIEYQIRDCLEQRLNDAVWLVGLQGGYTEISTEFIETPFSDVAYGLKDEKIILATKDKIESEISRHLIFSSPFCIQEINYTHHTKNTSIKTTEQPLIKTKIESDLVVAYVKIPIYISDAFSTYKLDREFKIITNVRLGQIHNFAIQILEQQKKEGEYIPISYLSEIETQIFFDYYDDKTIYFIIHDEESTIDDIPYSFLFAAELNSEDLR